MALYDANPLLGILQQGYNNAQQTQMSALQQPRPADVFLDRLRQAKQDQLHMSQLELTRTYKQAQMQNMEQNAASRAEQAAAATRRSETYAAIQPALAAVKQQIADTEEAYKSAKTDIARQMLQPRLDKLMAEHDLLVSRAANADSEAAARDALLPYRQNLMAGQADRAWNYRPEGFTMGGGVGGTRGDLQAITLLNKMTEDENKRRSLANQNIVGGIDITTGKPGVQMPMATPDEMLQRFQEYTSGLSGQAATPGSGTAISGGRVVMATPGGSIAPQPQTGRSRLKAMVTPRTPATQPAAQPQADPLVGTKTKYPSGTQLKDGRSIVVDETGTIVDVKPAGQ